MTTWKDVARITDAQAKRDPGNCYEAAATIILRAADLGLVNATLVHATATGQGDVKGILLGHAWVEADDVATGLRLAYDYSNGKHVVLPAALYRMIGKIVDAVEYTPDEANAVMADQETYGPWHVTTAAHVKGPVHVLARR